MRQRSPYGDYNKGVIPNPRAVQPGRDLPRNIPPPHPSARVILRSA